MGIFIVIIMTALILGGCSFRMNRGGGENPVGQAAAKTAGKYIGVPYVYGGRSPRGFDCSGLALYVYKQHGVKLPPTSKTQAKAGKPVKKKELLPGDLVFFRTSTLGGVGHVGIYIGGGQFIHAPGTGKRVKKAALEEKYFKARYHSARRVN
jgi:cell wall-associated NlpC family hydrolase